MAKSNAVWGIDIGQCALKALRCRPHDKDPTRVVAESFDYIEYPKILSQPEADRGKLVSEAIAQFISRNDLSGDHVAISVPGQTGLARFIKLPPVESKKIPDIVKYEARQQIPFSLEDVVWDYQQLAGGSEEEGYVLETEVGLFAMKKDQVTRSLKPFEDAGIDVDFIQLAPLSIYNFFCFDRLGNLHGGEPYDPENPPASTVVISLGTDTTDLVVTNGYRVWQRNIPIGGNHFTKALSKELKLTFSKAEHLKRHATHADDPKAVFQAMRPVFSDLLAEVQRSIGYFTSVDKTARIGGVVALGNAMKLPGLQRYLSQNLEQNVVPIKEYERLVGGSVTAGPQFRENLLSFAVSYGLCVQGLGLSELRTNLLPEELITQRLIRAKKPWAIAGLAALLVGCSINYFATYASLKSADLENNFKSVLASAESTQRKSQNLTSEYEAAKTKFAEIDQIGKNLVSNVEGRLRWLELLRAVSTALPKENADLDETGKSMEELSEAISERRELHIESLDCQRFEDMSTWYTGIANMYRRDSAEDALVTGEPADDTAVAVGPVDGDADAATPGEGGGIMNPEALAEPDSFDDMTTDGTAGGGAGATEGPAGPGCVIQLKGYHYHNGVQGDEGTEFIRKTLLKNLTKGTVKLPPASGNPIQPAVSTADETEGEEAGVVLMDVPMKDIVISYPVIVQYSAISNKIVNLESNEPGMVGGSSGADSEEEKQQEPKILRLRRIDFTVQFCWQPKTPSEREKEEAETEGNSGFATTE